jgi:hypothetical protein
MYGTEVIKTCKKYWDKFGFNEGLSEQKAEEFSVILDNLTLMLINDELKNLIDLYRKEDIDLETLLFPLIRVIVEHTDNFDMDELIDYLWELDLDMLKLTNDNLLLLKYNNLNNADIEAELTKLMSDIFVFKFNNKIK